MLDESDEESTSKPAKRGRATAKGGAKSRSKRKEVEEEQPESASDTRAGAADVAGLVEVMAILACMLRHHVPTDAAR
jgi:hypothetical protein